MVQPWGLLFAMSVMMTSAMKYEEWLGRRSVTSNWDFAAAKAAFYFPLVEQIDSRRFLCQMGDIVTKQLKSVPGIDHQLACEVELSLTLSLQASQQLLVMKYFMWNHLQMQSTPVRWFNPYLQVDGWSCSNLICMCVNWVCWRSITDAPGIHWNRSLTIVSWNGDLKQ